LGGAGGFAASPAAPGLSALQDAHLGCPKGVCVMQAGQYHFPAVARLNAAMRAFSYSYDTGKT